MHFPQLRQEIQYRIQSRKEDQTHNGFFFLIYFFFPPSLSYIMFLCHAHSRTNCLPDTSGFWLNCRLSGLVFLAKLMKLGVYSSSEEFIWWSKDSQVFQLNITSVLLLNIGRCWLQIPVCVTLFCLSTLQSLPQLNVMHLPGKMTADLFQTSLKATGNISCLFSFLLLFPASPSGMGFVSHFEAKLIRCPLGHLYPD